MVLLLRPNAYQITEHYKAMVNKTMWYWYRNRRMNIRTQKTDTDP